MDGWQEGSCGGVGTQGRGNDCRGRGEENEVDAGSCDIALLALLGVPNHDARSRFPNTSVIQLRLEKYEPPTAQALQAPNGSMAHAFQHLNYLTDVKDFPPDDLTENKTLFIDSCELSKETTGLPQKIS